MYIDSSRTPWVTGFCCEKQDNSGVHFLENFKCRKTVTHRNWLRLISNRLEILSEKQGFRKGVALVVICGWGRGFISSASIKINGWSVEFISASDLNTLHNSPEFELNDIWRLIQARDSLKKVDVSFTNLGGLLNLYSYAKDMSGHLLAHEDTGKEINGNPLNVALSVGYLSKIRHKAYKARDLHTATFSDGVTALVERKSKSFFFNDEANDHFFASISHACKGELRCVCQSQDRQWFCIVGNSFNVDAKDKDMVFRVWDAASIWLYRTVRFMEKEFAEAFLNIGNIDWIINFDKSNDTEFTEYSYDELCEHVSVEVTEEAITTSLSGTFIHGFKSIDNKAERCLVRTLIEGVFKLITIKDIDDGVESILNNIVKSNDAKWVHSFEANEFLDFVPPANNKATLTNEFDDANIRIDLAGAHNARVITGVGACTSFLNGLIPKIWEKVKAILQEVNKEQLIALLLSNINAISCDKTHWQRTTRAMLATSEDVAETQQVILEYESELNKSLLTCRLLIEMTICKGNENGCTPTNLDITNLMSYASLLHFIGGWSNAIKYGVFSPKITVTTHGQFILDDESFSKTITSYGERVHEVMIQNDSKNYEQLFSKTKGGGNNLAPEFTDAWLKEVGFPIEVLGEFITKLEDYGIEKRQAMFSMTTERIIDLCSPLLSEDDVYSLLDILSLKTREEWHKVPEGFRNTDWQPWRFRRRLSLVCKPIIKIEDNRYLLAPSLIRESSYNLMRNYHDSFFDAKQASSKEMKAWIGAKNHDRGHHFNSKVAKHFTSLGWDSRSDVNLTEILGSAYKVNGDIDVLAWNDLTKEVLVIECKDLIFAKTCSEIADQIYEFQGEYKENGNKKPDRLKKHLLRLDALSDNSDSFFNFMNVSDEYTVRGALVFSRNVPIGLNENPNLEKVEIIFFEDLKDKFNLER